MSFTLCRVMLRFADPVDQTAAVLHDVVEDTEITLDDLRDAGYKPEVVDAIDALTHHTHESYEQYIDASPATRFRAGSRSRTSRRTWPTPDRPRTSGLGYPDRGG